MQKREIPPSMEINPAGFLRRLAAFFYDLVLLIAIILFAVTVFTLLVDMLFGENAANRVLANPLAKIAYQAYLLAIAVLFYAWFWSHGGQTLGMKVWKLKLFTSAHTEPPFRLALKRVFFAIITCLPMGLGFFWSLFNPQRQTLYDLWTGTVMERMPE